jgi:phage shock protein PspC (stress-responsive transcriptional regulator)
MTQYREEVVRTSVEPASGIVEERTVRDDGLGSRVVHTTTTAAPPTPVRTTRVIRRWWRRAPMPAASTEYVTTPSYALDPSLAQFLRIAWFLLGLLECVLALRFVLSLLGANERNDFAATVYSVTWAFVGPFRTLFATPASGASSLELFTLVAMLVYFIAWWAMVKMVGVVLNRSVDV